MVNHGRSHGCITCKRRRVKCDARKPQCQECPRVGRHCEGYRRDAIRIRFKDETTRYSNEGLRRSVARSTQKDYRNHPSSELEACASIRIHAVHPCQLDIAVSFFLRHIAGSDRRAESARGYLDHLAPALKMESPGSALQAAVEAVAIKLWSRLTVRSYGSDDAVLLHRALKRIRSAIASPDQRFSNATAMSALLLQLHDTFSALFDQEESRTIHREGAIALLQSSQIPSGALTYYNELLASALHYKVSVYFRQRAKPPANELAWLETRIIPALSPNPSSLLDIVGLSVVDIQYRINQALSKTTEDVSAQDSLFESIAEVDNKLQNWLSAVPKLWYPSRIRREKLNLSVPMHFNACDVYPSIQIATIWNVWRIYRISLTHMRLRLIRRHSTMHLCPDSDVCGRGFWDEPYLRATLIWEGRTLLDDICYSIPFYLGDRTEPTTLIDIEDHQHHFPSYHDLAETDEAFQHYKNSENYLSKVDHHTHVALQGPFHLGSILSHLLPLIPEELIENTPIERQRQIDWVSEQLARTLHLLRVNPELMHDAVRRRLHTVYIL